MESELKPDGQSVGYGELLGNVAILMKRCQVGVGGRNALDDAHSIMAECYGTLGAQMNEIERLRKLAHSIYAEARSQLGLLENFQDFTALDSLVAGIHAKPNTSYRAESAL